MMWGIIVLLVRQKSPCLLPSAIETPRESSYVWLTYAQP